MKILFEGGHIREMKERDIPRLHWLAKDQDVKKYFLGNQENTENYWKKVYSAQKRSQQEQKKGIFRTKYQLPIESSGLPYIQGLLTLDIDPWVYQSSIDLKKVLHRMEFKYFFGKASRRKGIEGRVIGSLLDYSFNHMNIGKVGTLCSLENKESVNTLMDIGFNANGINENTRLVPFELINPQYQKDIYESKR